MEVPGAEERFTDATNYAFDADANNRPQHKRNSLAALKDIVAGRKDWWEKKAGKTGTAGGRSKVTQSVALPNMAAAAGQGRPAQGLLFSLAPPDTSTSPTSATAPTAKTPTAAVHQSLPQLRPPQLSLQPDAAPAIGRSPSSASSLKRMLSRLTGRSPKAAAGSGSGAASPAPSPHSPAGSLPPMAYSPVSEGAHAKPAPFGSPAASSGGGADDTHAQRIDQGVPAVYRAQSLPSPQPLRPAEGCFDAQADTVSAVSLEQAFSANEEFSPSAARSSAAIDAGNGSPAEVQSTLKVPATVTAAAVVADGLVIESVPFSLDTAVGDEGSVDLQHAAQAAVARDSLVEEADHSGQLNGEAVAMAGEEECFADPEGMEEMVTAEEAAQGQVQHDAPDLPLQTDAAATAGVAACTHAAESHALTAQPEAVLVSETQQQLQQDIEQEAAAGDTVSFVAATGEAHVTGAAQSAVECAGAIQPVSPVPTIPEAASPAPMHMASPMLMSPLPIRWDHVEEQAAEEQVAEEQAAGVAGAASGDVIPSNMAGAVPPGASAGAASAESGALQAAVEREEEADAMMTDVAESVQDQGLPAVSVAAPSEAVVATHMEAHGSQPLAAPGVAGDIHHDYKEQQEQEVEEQLDGLMEVDAEMEMVEGEGVPLKTDAAEPEGAQGTTAASESLGEGNAIIPAQPGATESSVALEMPAEALHVGVAPAGTAVAVEHVAVTGAAVAMADTGMDLDVDMEAAGVQVAVAACPHQPVAAAACQNQLLAAAEAAAAAIQAGGDVAASVAAAGGAQPGAAGVEGVGAGLTLVETPSVGEVSLADLEAWMHGEGLEGGAMLTADGAEPAAADAVTLAASEAAVDAPAADKPIPWSAPAAGEEAIVVAEAAEAAIAVVPLDTFSTLAVVAPAPAPAPEASNPHASSATGLRVPTSPAALNGTLDLAAPVSPLAMDGTMDLTAPVSPLAYGAMMDLTGPVSPMTFNAGLDLTAPVSPMAFNSTLDLTAPVSPLTFNPTLELMSMDEGGQSPGFGFAVAGLTAGMPPLESTPSPVAKHRQAGQHVPFAQAVRDSIPLFGVQQSVSVNDSVALDRLSLDDIAPYSRKKAPQHPAMDTLMEQPGDFTCSPCKELPGPGTMPQDPIISDSPTLPSQHSPPGSAAAPTAAAASKPTQAPATAAATPAPVSGRTYGMAPGSARAGHGLRGGSGGGGGTAVPSAGGGANGAPLSGRTRGGVYAPSAGGGSGAAPATPANTGSALSSRSRGVYGAGMGSAVKGGKSAAADPASTPLTQQAAARRPAVSNLKKPAPTPATARAASAGGATPGVSAGAGSALRQMRTTSPQVAAAAPAPLALASPVFAAAAAASPAATAAAASPAAVTSASADMAAISSPSLAGHAPQPQLPSSWATPLAQMAALPLEAALHAPLVDHSPFLEDWASGSLRDSTSIAEEARKLFSSLATAAPALPTAQLRTPVPAAGMRAGSAVPMPSPSTIQMLEMQMGLMVQKLADAESRLAVLEKENEGLRDQLATVQFQSGLTSEGAEDLERQARECAEEQLAVVTARLAIAEEAAASNRREADAARDRGEELARRLEQQAAAHSCEVEGLKARLSEVSHEREAACAQAESLTAQLSSKGSECNAFQAALLAEQRRVDELQAASKARDAEMMQLHKASADTSAKLQKALESLTTAQVNQRKAAAESEGKTAALSAAMTRMQEDRNMLTQQLAAATAQAKEAEAQAAQLRKDVAAGAAENKELLTICNQLLSQVEKNGGKQ